MTLPDCASPATWPRGSQGLTSPMYVELLVVQSTAPMQLGPSSAMPCRTAISATARCIAAAASPPSTTPPPGITRLGTPASAASCAKRAARSGLTARITESGRSGSASSVGKHGCPNASA